MGAALAAVVFRKRRSIEIEKECCDKYAKVLSHRESDRGKCVPARSDYPNILASTDAQGYKPAQILEASLEG
jgi:hypothetical protein